MMDFLDHPGDDPKRAARRPYLAFILVALAVGGTAGVFTEPAIPTWYAALNKPGFTPPDWIFAPVWTALYVLMGVAAARVFKRSGLKSPEITAWGIQLFFNFCWSGLFFGRHAIALALADIILLWLAVLVTLILFWRQDRIAGLLMLPYLAWTGFALALNQGFLALNPH